MAGKLTHGLQVLVLGSIINDGLVTQSLQSCSPEALTIGLFQNILDDSAAAIRCNRALVPYELPWIFCSTGNLQGDTYMEEKLSG